MLPCSLTLDSQWRFEFQQRSRGLNQTFTQDWKIWAVSQVPPQDDESPPDGCSLFLSLQSTTEPLRGDDTKIKVVMEMKDVVEVKSGNGWRKVNQHVIKPAKHGESRNQLRNDAPLEGKWYLTDSTAAVKYKKQELLRFCKPHICWNFAFL